MKKEHNNTNYDPKGFLLWDMAGTLIPYDTTTGRAIALPDIGPTLQKLKQDFRLAVTTGDHTTSAQEILSDFDLLCHFENVYGGLLFPIGKPHGKILRELGIAANQSLSIGDRLQADIASDCTDLVTILINQNSDLVNAGQIAQVIETLNEKGENFPDAFAALAAESEPMPESTGFAAGGEIRSAWSHNSGTDIRLLIFVHPALDSERMIIVI